MTPHKPDRPNVLVFMTDQQRWDSLGVHGNPLDLTPNLDCLAGSGTDMTHAFTPQPVCAPARSVLQTGQYATQTGVFRNSLALKPESRTLAHHFNDAGYDTAYIGKWHLADSGVEPVPPELRGGYQHWLAADIVEFISDAYDARLFNSDGEQVRMPGYRSDAHIDAAIRYIADRTRPRA
ncbi:MAG: sulfatase-like hydrolase/transferase, partial [Micromonosporaceae bacterium]